MNREEDAAAIYCSPGLWPEEAAVVIIGAGGLAREVLGICYELGAEDRVLGFLDPNPALEGAVLDGKSVLGSDDWLSNHIGPRVRFLIGVGDNARRRHISLRLEDAGMRPATIVSPQAVVSRFARILPGSVTCPGSIINTNVTVGQYCIINPDCTIGHDAVLGAFVHLGPGVHISGCVTLGEGVYVGTGAVVNERLTVAEWSILGSMAAVAQNLSANVTAVGVPARPIKVRPSGWQL